MTSRPHREHVPTVPHLRDPSRHPAARRRSTLLGALALLAAGSAAGCEGPVAPPEVPPASMSISRVVSELPETCGATTTVDLIADGTVPAGTVKMSNDGEHLYVVYETSSDWPIAKTALFVGDDPGEIPTSGGGNPQVGRFPYGDRHAPGTTEVIWEVDLAEVDGATAVVAAFAEIGQKKEGAWADGEPITSGGSWATYATHEIQSCVQGPTAIISAPVNGATVQAGTPLAFDGSDSQDPAGGGLVYAWDFGDDEFGGGAQIAHIYASAGTFTAALTVTDENGLSDDAQVEVQVTAAPPPAATDGILRGSVVDPLGDPLPGVGVSLVGGGSLGTTDAAGEIVIESFPTGVDRTLRLSLTGFADDIVRVLVPADLGVGYFEGGLRPRNAPLQLADAGAGGTLSGEDGAELVLPPGALVDGNGDPVSGPVDVAITPVDVSGPELAAFPGAFEGVGSEGTTGMIVSLGATEYVVTQGGQELQLAPGATATVRLPIYTTGAGVGDPVPLWVLDEASGLWIQEGEGVVVAGSEGPVLEAEVGHLSWWNADFETDVTIDLGRCLVEGPVVTWSECLFGARTVDDGPSWAGEAVVPVDGAELAFPAGTQVQLDATVFAEECVARGSAVVDIPASGGANPIEILVDCLDDDDPAARIEYGDRVIDEIEAPDDVDGYVWAGVAGEEVRVDLLASNSLRDGFYRITDPDGNLVEDGTFGDRNRHRFLTLEKSGDYRLEVSGEQADDTGFYRFRVDRFTLDHLQALTLPASVEGTIGFPELEVDIHQFEAAAGDEVSFAIRTENRLDDWFFRFEGEIRVLSPSDEVLAEEFFGHTSRELGARGLRLPEEGTYTVEVRSRNGLGQPDDPGAYAFELEQNPSMPLVDGDLVAGAISESLEVDAYRFEFATAETVRIGLTGPSGGDLTESIRIRIHDPDGTELVYSGGQIESHWFIETPAGGGEYRITIHGGDTFDTPDYELALDVFEEEPVQTLVDGDAAAGEIGFPQEVDSYEFEGQDGEEMTLAVEAAQTEAFEGTVEITDPNGLTLETGVFDQDAPFGDVRTLSETGTYVVEVAGTDGIPFDYEISLALAAPADPNALTPGDIIESSIDVASGSEAFTFEGTSGQAVRLHAITATSSTFNGVVSLTAPSNTELLNEALDEDGSVNEVIDLTEDGTYTIVVEEAAGTGGYKLGLGTGIGRRDLTFGPFGIGEVRADFGSGRFEQVESLADGKILARTSSRLFRFDATGATDAGFGSSGEVSGFAVFGVGGIRTFEVFPDASILMAVGVRNTEFNGWKVAKLDADGALDPSFGTDGVVEVPFDEAIGFNEFPASILPVPDGTDHDILVVGTTRAPDLGPRVVTMVRLDSDGSPDASFGGGANPLITSLSLRVKGGSRQSDGRIVVGGTWTAGEATAYRFDPDGTQDLTFGTSGEATIVHGTSGSINGMEIRPDDRFILHGSGFNNMLAVQFTAAGAPDASFDTDGVVLIDYGHSEVARGAVVDGATGNLYLAGGLDIQDSGEPEGMLLRLLPDGSLDTSFGAGGLLLEGTPDRFWSLALDGSGGLIVGTEVISSSSTATLLRLLR